MFGYEREKLGLMFAPATGNDIFNCRSLQYDKSKSQERHHSVDNSGFVSNGRPDASCTQLGNRHRCIHHDSWEKIAYWNKTDPYVYERCMADRCTTTVRVLLSAGNKIGDYVVPLTDITYGHIGSGIMFIRDSDWGDTDFCDCDDCYTEVSYEQSLIRHNTQEIIGNFPTVLQSAIGYRDLGGYADQLWVPTVDDFVNSKAIGCDAHDVHSCKQPLCSNLIGTPLPMWTRTTLLGMYAQTIVDGESDNRPLRPSCNGRSPLLYGPNRCVIAPCFCLSV